MDKCRLPVKLSDRYNGGKGVGRKQRSSIQTRAPGKTVNEEIVRVDDKEEEKKGEKKRRERGKYKKG